MNGMKECQVKFMFSPGSSILLAFICIAVAATGQPAAWFGDRHRPVWQRALDTLGHDGDSGGSADAGLCVD